MKIAIINGPNLNLLGKRQPEVYGNVDFESFLTELNEKFSDTEISYYQSNDEGDLINQIQNCDGAYQGIVLNPGGYTHTSVAIADAVSSIKCPVIEVHISNIYQREAQRHQSLLSKYCKGSIVGLGLIGYQFAVELLLEKD